MAKVLGIGGVFFKTKRRKALGAWYKKHLGLEVADWGGAVFPWREPKDSGRERYTVWSPFDAKTTYFAPAKEPYMVNYVVDDLVALLSKLRRARVRIDQKPMEVSEYGRFAWVYDLEGRKLELWEPPPRAKKKR